MTRALCDHCLGPFEPNRSSNRYCSTECAQADYQRPSQASLAAERMATLAEVAAELGVSLSRAQQIEAQALAKLRRLMRREEWV